jgi:hypothetical protein
MGIIWQMPFWQITCWQVPFGQLIFKLITFGITKPFLQKKTVGQSPMGRLSFGQDVRQKNQPFSILPGL